MTDTTSAPAVLPVAGTPTESVPTPPRDDLGRFTSVDPVEPSGTVTPPIEGASADGPTDPTQASEVKPDGRRERNRQRWQEMKARVRESESQAQYWQSMAQKRMQEAAQPVDPAQFQTDAEYQGAIAAQAMRRVSAQDHMSQAEASRQRAEADDRRALDVQAEDLRDQIKDIDLIYRNPSEGGPVITPAMAAAIHESESGALLAYHLAKNPTKALTIANMQPLAAARAIGKLEAELSSRPMKRISQAPAPVQTVSGGVGSPGVDLSTLSMADYIKARQGA